MDEIIDGLVLIGNHKRVKEICELNVSEPMELKRWMVIRVLKSLELFENEWRIYQNAGGTIQETSIPVEGAVRGNT